MAQDNMRGPIEAALAETHFKSGDDGKRHVRVQWPSNEMLVMAEVALSEAGAFPSASYGEAGCDAPEPDQMVYRIGNDAEAGVSANQVGEEDSADNGMAWVDVTDGWAL